MKTKITILVIDDNQELRELFKLLLGSENTYLEASNATDGIALFDTHPEIEAVITDYEMPDQNGLYVVKSLRDRDPNIPILFASGKVKHPFAPIALDAIGAGADEAVAQPCKLAQDAIDAGASNAIPKPWQAMSFIESFWAIVEKHKKAA